MFRCTVAAADRRVSDTGARWDDLSVTTSVEALVAAGRAALQAGDAAGARRSFEVALERERNGTVMEGLARAFYLQLDHAAAIERWEQAYALHRDADDRLGAVRVARMLGYMHGTVLGEPAVMRGWLARAHRMLGDRPSALESGWVSLDVARFFEPDPGRQEKLYESAIGAGRAFGDVDLEFVALAYLGSSLVRADRTDAGMRMLDEALAAVAGEDLDDFISAQEIFCQLFMACEHAHDVSRADQWIRIGIGIAERRRLPGVAAFCNTHYGGILTVAGRWTEADVALTEAVGQWDLGHRALRGGALARLAGLRVLQGRFEEAEQLLEGLDGRADAAAPLGALHLAAGRPAIARDVIERALEQARTEGTDAAPLLALLVEAHLAAATFGAAGEARDRLTACAERHRSDYLSAAAAFAAGQICLASGTGDALGRLREALACFLRAEMPLEVARVRLAMAGLLAMDRPEVARAEARAALEGFEMLQAQRHTDAAAALLRSLGVRVRTRQRKRDGVLTKRESEVLALLALGLSNPAISDRLFISRKTVEHHVGHILAKLDLSGRAEAAAYAVRSRPAQK